MLSLFTVKYSTKNDIKCSEVTTIAVQAEITQNPVVLHRLTKNNISLGITCSPLSWQTLLKKVDKMTQKGIKSVFADNGFSFHFCSMLGTRGHYRSKKEPYSLL